MPARAALGQLAALARANARFWPSVAPLVWRELSAWRATAEQIEQPELRALALHKLDTESFNAEVAATLATLAPPASRESAVTAMVALEVLFDYLDGRSEQIADAGQPQEESLRLLGSLVAAVSGEERWEPEAEDEDGRYLELLIAAIRARAARLPSHAAVVSTAAAAARRCAAAQSALHHAAVDPKLESSLEHWARAHARGSELDWQDYVGGSASSVLAIHALFAMAAQPGLAATNAETLDRAYLAIGALVTLLDSVVDEVADSASGHGGFLRLLGPPEQVELRARALARLAATRAAKAPDAAHHAMTLSGIVSYYTTHPGARASRWRSLVTGVRSELSPEILPTLAVMRTWRAARRGRGAVGAARAARAAGRKA